MKPKTIEPFLVAGSSRVLLLTWSLTAASSLNVLGENDLQGGAAGAAGA